MHEHYFWCILFTVKYKKKSFCYEKDTHKDLSSFEKAGLWIMYKYDMLKSSVCQLCNLCHVLWTYTCLSLEFDDDSFRVNMTSNLTLNACIVVKKPL